MVRKILIWENNKQNFGHVDLNCQFNKKMSMSRRQLDSGV